MSHDDQQFIDRARLSLEQRLDQTPSHVSARLRGARNQALESRHRWRDRTWLPAMATAALLAVVVSGTWFAYGPGHSSATIPGAVQAAADFEMLTRGDDLALYDNVDFYLWLDKQGLNAG